MHLMTLGGSKKQWSYVSMSGGFIDWLFCCCVCYDLTCRGFKHFSTPGHSLSFLVKSCKGVISIYIIIYVCMWIYSGCFQGECDTRNIGLARKIHSLIFLQCLQDYAIWLMTARCLALDDGSRASSSGSQCAIAPAGDKLHSIPIDKLMEVGGSAIHSCCSRASTDTDRWQSPLGAFQFCFDNWNHSCFSAGAVIFNKREKTLSQQSFTHD